MCIRDSLETVLPDVVITDICMPFLDGLELAKLVYERFPETIVVVLTGFSEFSYAQKAIRYHVHDYLLKPVSPKEFDQLLENLSAELSRRENRQGLYSRAVMADEVLKDHFFQSLLQTDAPQELPASMREAGAGLGGRLHAVALALPPARPEGIEARGQRVAEVCAPAQFRLLGDQHVMLIVSGDETAELMARTAAGARQLRMQLQEADVHTAIGIGGAYAGVDGLRTSAQEAQHALGLSLIHIFHGKFPETSQSRLRLASSPGRGAFGSNAGGRQKCFWISVLPWVRIWSAVGPRVRRRRACSSRPPCACRTR